MENNLYQKGNSDYWEKGYVNSDNVESWVFRVYGRILKNELNLSGSENEKMLDFGCGTGGALLFFKNKGFDVYGVDISERNIDLCQSKMPEIKEHFFVNSVSPDENERFFGGNFDLVIAIQSLYYLSDSDMQKCLASLHSQMNKGGIIYVTMMGTKCSDYYNNSVEVDGGLRKVSFKNDRLTVDDHYINFTKNEEDLLNKFSLFEKLHIGYYDAKYRESEGTEFHWIYIGRKN
jgi:SAM-dependent methyltransferase